MTVKIEYVGRNEPGSPVHQFTTDEGFVVGDSEKGYVNVLPEHVWFAVDEFAAMSEEERQPMLQSVVSAVEAAHQVGHDNLPLEARHALYDDIGILFGECLRTLGVSPADHDRLEPFTAFFTLPDPRPLDAQGQPLGLSGGEVTAT